jgi:hypothetical protein
VTQTSGEVASGRHALLWYRVIQPSGEAASGHHALLLYRVIQTSGEAASGHHASSREFGPDRVRMLTDRGDGTKLAQAFGYDDGRGSERNRAVRRADLDPS